MSGRAVAFPIYKYTFERSDPKVTSSWPAPTRAYTTWMQQIVIDARRTLDYLETRSDLAGKQVGLLRRVVGRAARADHHRARLAYRRRRAGHGRPRQRHTGARSRSVQLSCRACACPILMVNGDQDFIFPLQTTQRAAVRRARHAGGGQAARALSRRPRDHRRPSAARSFRKSSAWLDKYLGRVQ